METGMWVRVNVWMVILLFPLSNYAQSPLFKELSPEKTHLHFSNNLKENKTQNIFVDFNFYSGAGVSIGDFNNDGLPDLYFTSNQEGNKLFKNLGNMQFEEVTETSHTAGKEGWTSGSTLADVNGDGLLDIYVCQSGQFPSGEILHNQLFINEGNFQFSEQSETYGLNDPGRSLQATFFDYDRDNDLDVYVVNRPFNFNAQLLERVKAEMHPNSKETDRLYRNDNGKFVDVTDQAGMRNFGFGLNAIACDFNNNGFIDLFVCNDYSEPDHYWINQGNGTFKMAQNSSFLHLSNFSMGSDFGDFNNDGNQDLMVVDMMAKDNRRKKTNMSGMDEETFWEMVNLGRHFQYMQNVLQLNNGNGTFSDVAELSGISNTDWSWSPLLADFDNDGWQDLFVSNGMRKEVRNNDFAKKLVGIPMNEMEVQWENLSQRMPVEPIPNFCYQNNGDLTFSDRSNEWGLAKAGFSTGAAVADLDLDGDLDLVLNNIDEPASIFENQSSHKRSLRIKAVGPPANAFGLNLKAKLVTSAGIQSRELTLTRGFKSSSEPILHFGLAPDEEIQSLSLIWPDGKEQELSEINENQLFLAQYKEAFGRSEPHPAIPQAFFPFTHFSGLDFTHEEKWYNDFEKEVLIPHQYSQNGPMLAKGDLNGDNLEDLFVGGAAGQAAGIYLQSAGGKFKRIAQPALVQDSTHEDMGAVFTDTDLDGDLDLLIASGSNEKPKADLWYQHRLYLNDGQGQFTKDETRLPELAFSGSRVRVADMDGDGDEDVFIGGRLIPGEYPRPASSVLLRNDDGKYVNITQELAPELTELGLVTDAVWVDIDQDKDLDLLVCGEWMSIEWFEQKEGKFVRSTKGTGLEQKVGWWYSLQIADVDEDGDQDLIAGNLGLNSKYQASDAEPFEVYSDDMDENGTLDIVLGYNADGKTFPVRGRQCSSEQVPKILENFPNYETFGNATLIDVYGDALNKSLHYSANWMASSLILNNGNGTFSYQALPNSAQLSTANTLITQDFTGDGHLDILVAGNLFTAEVETARHDASVGAFLKGDGTGNFSALSLAESGFFAQGDVKDMAVLKDDSGKRIIVITRNGGPLKVFRER